MRKLAVLILMAIVVTACGKKGPLIYPELLALAAPSGLSAQQFGNSIKLSFVLPSKDLAGRDFSGVTGVNIIKRDEASGSNPSCSNCTTDFSAFRKLNLEPLSPNTLRSGNLLVLLDGDVQEGRTYTYRVSGIAKDNQEGTLSAPVDIAMVAMPLSPVLQVSSQPTEIQLDFTGLPPLKGVIAGYNVYRALKGDVIPFQSLNREPLAANRFVDVGLERGMTYTYGVRMVVRLPSGLMVESALSNEVGGKLKDDE